MAEACSTFFMDRTCLARGFVHENVEHSFATEPLVHKLSGRAVFHFFMDRACLARGLGPRNCGTPFCHRTSPSPAFRAEAYSISPWTEPVWQEASSHEIVERGFARNLSNTLFQGRAVLHFFIDRTCLASRLRSMKKWNAAWRESPDKERLRASCAVNSHLRTGADKENPTAELKQSIRRPQKVLTAM